MAFKIKDLMISVVAAKAGAGRICEGTCPDITCDVASNGCDIDATQIFCDFCSDFGSGCIDCSDGTCDCSDGTWCDPCSGGCTDCTVCTACTVCTVCTVCTACSGCTCTKCTGCTCTHCTVHTCTIHTGCGACTASIRATARLRSSDLPKLKAHLQRALKQVEAREQAVAQKLQPRTVEQIEMLEAKLREALEELARQKKELPAKEEKKGPKK